MPSLVWQRIEVMVTIMIKRKKKGHRHKLVRIEG